MIEPYPELSSYFDPALNTINEEDIKEDGNWNNMDMSNTSISTAPVTIDEQDLHINVLKRKTEHQSHEPTDEKKGKVMPLTIATSKGTII